MWAMGCVAGVEERGDAGPKVLHGPGECEGEGAGGDVVLGGQARGAVADALGRVSIIREAADVVARVGEGVEGAKEASEVVEEVSGKCNPGVEEG
eukprot:CAMPEP_0195577564 /NCGR_PEP_ID=MMETSP0814-20130614/10658_1 /TAXON_ID=97485 /ORGANISM="Prymnesium parvum, Strain Texoma1" /LENGTH=94 /DNA_ID=CAMNT_0040713973 /DNA_START=121 /DNA_END=405 /DNA_ORIENTATION=-